MLLRTQATSIAFNGPEMFRHLPPPVRAEMNRHRSAATGRRCCTGAGFALLGLGGVDPVTE
jgi:cytochrome P450